MSHVRGFRCLLVLLGLACGTAPLLAGAHTWDVEEVFSNADGTIQFIELHEQNGAINEVGVGGHNVTSNVNTFNIPSNVGAPTSFKHLLFATDAFAALPGAPTPDYIIPANFFLITGDTISYTPYDTLKFIASELPTDGINSLYGDRSTGVNSPTNYNDQTGSVDASSAPPSAVPDGTGGTAPVTVTKLVPGGTSISIAWDTMTCGDAQDHQIVYGEGSQLPDTPGGSFFLSGSVCGLGSNSPFVWNTVPNATDGTGLLWWLILVNNDDEGSWGKDSGGAERSGPGAGGSSAQCGATAKDLSNSCGQ